MPVEKFLENHDRGGLVDDRSLAFLLAAGGTELAFGLAGGAVFIMEMDGKICGEHLGQCLGKFPHLEGGGAFRAVLPHGQSNYQHFASRRSSQMGNAGQGGGSGLRSDRLHGVGHETEIVAASDADTRFTEIEGECFH